MTEKKKVTQCKDGKHTFMITRWNEKGGYKKAVSMRCRNCLMPMGLEEIEMMEWKEQEGI